MSIVQADQVVELYRAYRSAQDGDELGQVEALKQLEDFVAPNASTSSTKMSNRGSSSLPAASRSE
jgi:hypothetical protein